MADLKITELTAFTTPVDADLGVMVDDPAGTPVTKKITWANIKATLKTYFDTLYQAAGSYMADVVTTKGDVVVGDASGDAARLGVGTDTHVLTADSGEASGVKWAAAGGAGGPTFYEPRSVVPFASIGAAQTAYYAPFVSASTISVTKILYWLKTLAGTPTIEVGIYTDSAGAPNTKLVSATDAPVSVGVKTVTIDSQELSAGVPYWLAIVIQTTPNASKFCGAVTVSDAFSWETAQATLPATAGATSNNTGPWLVCVV